MKKILFISSLFILLIGAFAACTKEQESTTQEKENIVDSRSPKSEDSGNNISTAAQQAARCCTIQITSQTAQGLITYSVTNPSVSNPFGRRRVTIIDADYGGILYQYSWGQILGPCASHNPKFHLQQIVQQNLGNCLNRYQVLMELQTKASSTSPWVTCSSALSNVFELGTNPNCE